MRPTHCTPFYVLVAWMALLPVLHAQQTVSVSVLDGTEIRCYPDSLVRIEITPNTNFAFTQIFVSWGDGSPSLTINPGDPLILEHEYPIAQFLDDCTYGEGCPSFASNGFCFGIAIEALYGNATTPENVAKRITFKFPPRPNLAASDNYICAGETTILRNLTCPQNDVEMRYYWLFPDGSTSTLAEPSYTFATAGTYPVQLTAVNACDSITTTRNITVNALPMANAVVDSGSVALQGSQYVVCLSEGGRVRFNGDGSQFETSYNWGISPGSGYVWQGNRMNDTTLVLFTTPGTYTATLRVDNQCQQPDEASFSVEVLPALSLNLEPQPDSCLSLRYTPTIITGASYILNGVAYTPSDFPVNLTASNTPYTLTATLANICDTIIRRDTFFVFGQFIPSITAPATNSSICRDTNLLLLQTDTPGGNWSIDNGLPLIVQNGQTYFNANQPNGTYSLTYRVGFGACEGLDTRTIIINSPEIALMPLILCEDDAPTTLPVTPTGGQWQGIGIVNEALGIFDPNVATPGSHQITYTFIDTVATGCTVTNSTIIEVVALPTINNVPDLFLMCEVDEVLSLPDLTGISFSPNTGVAEWAGQGILTTSTGTYNPANVTADMDTIRLSYTLDPGCTTRDTFILRIDEITPVDAGEDRTICDNTGNPLLTASPQGGRWSGTGIDATSGEINLSTLAAGQTYTYTYTINADIPSCQNSDEVNITIAPGQGVSLSFDEVFVCDTASIVALPVGSPTPGTWAGATGISSQQVDIANWVPGVYTLTYTVPTLPTGCNTAEFTIHLASRPTVDIISDSTACVTVDCLNFTANTSNAVAFQWQFGDGATSALQNTCHTYTSQGSYMVSVVGYLINPVTSTRYCASIPDAAEVDILGELPPIGIDASTLSGCPNLLVDLSPTAIVEHTQYTWSVASIIDSIATGLSGVFLPATTEDTTYQVKLTVSNGCTIIVLQTDIIAFAPLRANVGTDYDSPCNGETITFYNRSTGRAGSVPLWIFSNGNTYQGSEPPPFQVFTDSLPSTLDVLLIDSNACNIDTAFYSIEIQPTDVRARMNYSVREVCSGGSLLLINQSTPEAHIRWATSDGISYLGDTISHQFQQVGPAWIDIFAFGCGYDSTRYYFDILPAPSLGLLYEPFICAQNLGAFTATGDAAGTTLYFGNGDSTLVNTAQYAYTQAGNYTLRLIGQSAQGCLDSLERTITVLSLPIPMVIPPDSICAGETVTLISNSLDAQSCRWQLANEGFRDGCIIDYIFSHSGIQNNRLIVTSALGCTDSLDFPVYVRPTPVAAFTSIGNNECSPSQVSFFFTPGNQQPSAWLWDFGDGTTSTSPNPIHTYTFGGTYLVQLTVSIDGICMHQTQKDIIVRGTPQVTTLFTDERCLPTDNFIVEVLTDEDNEITITGPDFIQQGINRFDIPSPGDYTLEVISALGCDTALTFTVPEVFPLQLQLMPDTCIELGASVRLSGQVNAADINLLWSPGSTLSDSTVLSPIASPLATTTYMLTVSRNNCLVQDEVLVKVKKPEIYFPNAFSPNYDGTNDVYTIYPSISVDTILSFQVWSRWGQLIYECQKPSMQNEIKTWDGLFRDQPMNPGVFVFFAKVRFKDGRVEQFKGDIHLVR